MFIKEYECNNHVPPEVYDYYKMSDIAYFDIETTGFDKDKEKIILISLGHYEDEDNFFIRQYFADELDEESSVLDAFKDDISKFDIWCSYNGIAFDEPFIENRFKVNGLDFDKPSRHIDLFRMIKPYSQQIGLKRCNLKSVEKYIGIKRHDKIDGGMSVELYYDYLKNKNDDIRKTILLHNYEDVLNLPQIFNVVYDIECNKKLVRGDCITEKQLRFLKSLLKRQEIDVNFDIEKISKNAASKMINTLLKGKPSSQDLNHVLDSSY